MIVSGQRINVENSKIYVCNTNDVVTRKIVDTLGFSLECLPSTYLGIPFFVGANKSAYRKAIIDRIKNAISTWKTRWLSLSGRLLLIRIVLSGIPNYFMSILKAPARVIHQIEKLIRGFLWRDNMSEENKISLISIQEMTHDKGGGDVGLHDLSKRNIAFGGKLVWQMVSKPDTKW